MKNEIENYREMEQDLLKQINLCKQYKIQIKETLRKLQKQYEDGLIDLKTYNYLINEFLKGRSPEEWYDLYDGHISEYYENIRHYKEKIDEINKLSKKKKSSFSKVVVILGIVFLILGIMGYIQLPKTGFYVTDLIGRGTVQPGETFEDGYESEGLLWTDIRGSRLHERCLKVNSKIDFNSVNIISKITSAINKKDLAFSLYSNREVRDEPSELIGSCRITKYGELWKSCKIRNLRRNKGDYWICALSLGGNSEQVYYMIDYKLGGKKKTALWTGKNWQILDGISYTIKAQFIKNER